MIAVVDGTFEAGIVKRPAPPAGMGCRFVEEDPPPRPNQLHGARQPGKAGPDHVGHRYHRQTTPWRRTTHIFDTLDRRSGPPTGCQPRRINLSRTRR